MVKKSEIAVYQSTHLPALIYDIRRKVIAVGFESEEIERVKDVSEILQSEVLTHPRCI